MNWTRDGTNIHPQERLIGDFIRNISGMKRSQQVICVYLFQDQFDISAVLSFTQNWQSCFLFTNVGVILGRLGSYEILMSFGNEVGARFSWALVLSIFDFAFDFVEMRGISFRFLKDEKNGELLENVSRHEHHPV